MDQYRGNIITSFIKLKLTENMDPDSLYHKINEKKTTLTLSGKSSQEKSEVTEVTFNKVFSNEENSYIYEEIMKHKLQIFLSGGSMFVVGYGIRNSGKKSVIIGNRNANTNLNSRGMICRFIESALTKKKETTSLYFNFMVENHDCILDFTKVPEKGILTSRELADLFEPIVDKDYLNKSKKLEISTLDDFLTPTFKVMDLLYKHENTEYCLYSGSNLIFNVQLINNTNGKMLSNICFLVMANSDVSPASEILGGTLNTTKGLNKIANSRIRLNLKRNCDSIELINIMQKLVNIRKSYEMSLLAMRSQKSTRFLKEIKEEEIGSTSFEAISAKIESKKVVYSQADISNGNLKNFSSKLMFVIRYNFTVETYFAFIGFIYPSTGLYSKSKDTTHFIKKLASETLFSDEMQINTAKNDKQVKIDPGVQLKSESHDYLIEELEMLVIKKDEEMFRMGAKLKEYEDNQGRMQVMIGMLRDKIQKEDTRFKRIIDTISTELGFEGDINKLTLNTQRENVPEFLMAQSIKDSKIVAISLQNKNLELKAVIDKLQKDLETAKHTIQISSDTRAFAGEYLKIKEERSQSHDAETVIAKHSEEVKGLQLEIDHLKLKLKSYQNCLQEKDKALFKIYGLGKSKTIKNIEKEEDILSTREKLLSGDFTVEGMVTKAEKKISKFIKKDAEKFDQFKSLELQLTEKTKENHVLKKQIDSIQTELVLERSKLLNEAKAISKVCKEAKLESLTFFYFLIEIEQAYESVVAFKKDKSLAPHLIHNLIDKFGFTLKSLLEGLGPGMYPLTYEYMQEVINKGEIEHQSNSCKEYNTIEVPKILKRLKMTTNNLNRLKLFLGNSEKQIIKQINNQIKDQHYQRCSSAFTQHARNSSTIGSPSNKGQDSIIDQSQLSIDLKKAIEGEEEWMSVGDLENLHSPALLNEVFKLRKEVDSLKNFIKKYSGLLKSAKNKQKKENNEEINTLKKEKDQYREALDKANKSISDLNRRLESSSRTIAATAQKTFLEPKRLLPQNISGQSTSRLGSALPTSRCIRELKQKSNQTTIMHFDNTCS